ncbi:MBL fold metallo-hydrolase [Zeaxanthinibacter enoshimensis]|uniref:Glyoxylase-like metal-dependent hydrolase (Beta-lactamase superfamily II) n=1 Tax=Zeaxanthinibacter enoshimensis TaxID=392009 RepID=A0A4R6TN46_9FLAO|nr:MBL fold metallo-hydrolase [Zeaxanthinibacter enoshimensis]TDQ32665.1 glyoxylase-like metal-dependent hydrolase (beta-lactamase superfamily II) [Zeaxanthinibacter enoshimensis]
MEIKQFEDKPLAHFSYAILSEDKIALVDPARDPRPYYEYAEENNASIVAVFETHPHADFVSSHLQVHQETGATIYASKKIGADYPHQAFDDGDTVSMGKVTFSARNTPGHSPDSITIIAKDEAYKTAAFTGDTLFIGDVGRPDLREKAGNMKAKREELASMMYDSIKNKFTDLPDDTLIYPAHGAGSLCGKNLSSASMSTLGNERMGNWAFKEQSEEEFVKQILEDQPFIPAYFSHDVDLNKDGAGHYEAGKAKVASKLNVTALEDDTLVVDTRDEEAYKSRHLPNSINIMARNENDKFETWLGSIVKPGEPFYLVANSIKDREELLSRVAKIGYESQVKALVTLGKGELNCERELALDSFISHPEYFTVVDVRNKSEVNEGKIFDHALPIPLHELRNSIEKIPTDKPVIVHCAGGYRSAAGSSILSKELDAEVYDLSEAVNEFKDKD